MLQVLDRQLKAFRLRSAAALLEDLNYTETAHFIRAIADRQESGELAAPIPPEYRVPMFDAAVMTTYPHNRPTQYMNFTLPELVHVLSSHPAGEVLAIRIERAPGMKICPKCGGESSGYAACPDCARRAPRALGATA